jgi:two-component system chemotaxis response regulator CheB
MEIHGDVVRLTDDAPVGGLRPRADITLATAVRQFGKNMTGMVMTGMGSDGLIGCRDAKRHGGQVITQDGPSSTVDGMPRAIRNAGLADRIGPPAFLAEVLEKTPAQIHGQITAASTG